MTPRRARRDASGSPGLANSVPAGALGSPGYFWQGLAEATQAEMVGRPTLLPRRPVFEPPRDRRTASDDAHRAYPSETLTAGGIHPLYISISCGVRPIEATTGGRARRKSHRAAPCQKPLRAIVSRMLPADADGVGLPARGLPLSVKDCRACARADRNESPWSASVGRTGGGD